MLVQHRHNHLRFTTDTTATSLKSALHATSGHHRTVLGTGAHATEIHAPLDLAALYPALFPAEAPAQPSVGSHRIVVRLFKAAAVAAQFAIAAISHVYR